MVSPSMTSQNSYKKNVHYRKMYQIVRKSFIMDVGHWSFKEEEDSLTSFQFTHQHEENKYLMLERKIHVQSFGFKVKPCNILIDRCFFVQKNSTLQHFGLFWKAIYYTGHYRKCLILCPNFHITSRVYKNEMCLFLQILEDVICFPLSCVQIVPAGSPGSLALL